MKVVCIDNTSGNARHLELYRVYDTVEVDAKNSTDYYILHIDPYIIASRPRRLGEIRQVWVSKKSFITLEEYRQTKLRKLLID